MKDWHATDEEIKFQSIHQFLLLLLCRLWQEDNTATNQYSYVSELLWARRALHHDDNSYSDC